MNNGNNENRRSDQPRQSRRTAASLAARQDINDQKLDGVMERQNIIVGRLEDCCEDSRNMTDAFVEIVQWHNNSEEANKAKFASMRRAIFFFLRHHTIVPHNNVSGERAEHAALLEEFGTQLSADGEYSMSANNESSGTNNNTTNEETPETNSNNNNNGINNYWEREVKEEKEEKGFRGGKRKNKRKKTRKKR